jgi:CheY-like chemotaxis protein
MATILVVDDEPQIVRLVRDHLEAVGFSVLEASDGRTAVKAATTGRPDLVVLDLGLPELDGLEVTRALRKDNPVPIIMLTARSDESDKLVGLELGADDYITKPSAPRSWWRGSAPSSAGPRRRPPDRRCSKSATTSNWTCPVWRRASAAGGWS